MKVGLRCWASSHIYISDRSASGFWAKNETGPRCLDIEVAGIIWIDASLPRFNNYPGSDVERVRAHLKEGFAPSFLVEDCKIEWQDFGQENVELYPHEFDNPDFLYLESGGVVMAHD